jgi:hypothetical protein
MNWVEHIRKAAPNANYRQPASLADIAKAEGLLQVQLPVHLKALLLQTNGVLDEYESSILWTIDYIVSRNIELRSHPDFKTLYMPFDHLLFLGDAGNGDQFSYAILAGEIRNPDIFAWNHENDSRTWVAPNLERFIEWWFANKISI